MKKNIHSLSLQEASQELLQAAYEGDLSYVKDLLQISNLNLNIRNRKWGYTPLMFAILKGYESIVDALIKSGADVNTQDDYGESALQWAAKYKKNGNIIDKLMQAGADVNTQDNFGMTALMVAVKHCNEAIIDTLIQAGADVNAQNKESITALMIATVLKRESIVVKLKKAGALK